MYALCIKYIVYVFTIVKYNGIPITISEIFLFCALKMIKINRVESKKNKRIVCFKLKSTNKDLSDYLLK